MTNEMKMQVDLLYRDGYHCAAKIITELSTGFNKDVEMGYMESFLRERAGELNNEITKHQLRSMWTTFCMHHNLDVDTDEYDIRLISLWNIIVLDESHTVTWEEFDNFMCEYLV